jgi:hypothetical protein
MPSQRTYEVVDVILPSVLMVLIFIVTLALTIFGIIWKGCGCGKSDKPNPLVFLEMVDLAFPDLEKEKDNYDVFDKTIALPAFVILTVIIVPVISSTLFITFWNVYAVEESSGGACVENFDCFPRMGGEYLQQEPVENCSSQSFMPLVQNDSSNSSTLPLEVDITFDCYRLVFRYAEAFGAAGGILAITALCSKLYFSLMVYQSVVLLMIKYVSLSGMLLSGLCVWLSLLSSSESTWVYLKLGQQFFGL